jgi:hypothetical protein
VHTQKGKKSFLFFNLTNEGRYLDSVHQVTDLAPLTAFPRFLSVLYLSSSTISRAHFSFFVYPPLRTYEVLKQEVNNSKIRWAYLPYSMHMAGPREAIQHMIIRKNYG